MFEFSVRALNSAPADVIRRNNEMSAKESTQAYFTIPKRNKFTPVDLQTDDVHQIHVYIARNPTQLQMERGAVVDVRDERFV